MKKHIYLLFILTILLACQSQKKESPLELGAAQMNRYLPDLLGKNVALTVNHTSIIGSIHLVDTLISRGINVVSVFTPEHGFSGTADAGEKVESENSDEGGYRIESLYGSNKKPTSDQMEGIDMMIFDIQDVGARFYTYPSTMQYVMEACAENNIPVIILDRPNPNGSYVDGPVLDTAFRSFVGMNPVPVVHGLTIGEMAQMINGEGWLSGGIRADLKVITINGWDHSQTYSLPVRPSPNLPNDLSVALYPSICFFEGTVLSVGRGTDAPFQQFGHPDLPGAHQFVPKPGPGSKNPKLEGQLCFGKTYVETEPAYALNLADVIQAYRQFEARGLKFFNGYFDTLAGTDQLRLQIESGMSEEEIRAAWEPALAEYRTKREKYLLYP